VKRVPASVRDRIVLRPLHVDADTLPAFVEAATRRGFRRFALGPHLGTGPGTEAVTMTDTTLSRAGQPPIERRTIATPAELEGVLREFQTERAVALRWAGERVIPLENALARRGRGMEVWVTDVRPRETPAYLGALEAGADHVVVDLRDADELGELERYLDATPRAPIRWADATVTRVQPAGVGDRVLLDTTSLLAADEGFAVGSTASLLALILSEATGSRYTRPRRFRVNAGGPHSYVLMADGTTRYLSEIEPAEELLAMRTSGESRGVRLGRAKIERRPLVVVSLEAGGRAGTVFLQEAETVRLSSPERDVAVTDLRAGATVRALALPAARHLGGVIDETVEER
jgi:3-dehydroquinate synthase II